MKRIKHTNRKEWLKNRRSFRGIGASEASIIMQCNPWTTIDDLWEVKTGRKKPKNIDDKDCIKYGVAMEPLIRAQLALDCPQYQVEYNGYDLLVSDKNPFMFCTLDGELTEKETNRKGVNEIKTGSFRSRKDLEKWNKDVPDYYYWQVIHQLFVTEWDFDLVVARLKRDPFKETDKGIPEIVWRTVIFEKDDRKVQNDMKKLEREETKFWHNVETDTRPEETIITFNTEEKPTWKENKKILDWW